MNSSPAREHYTAMREKTPRPAKLSVDMEWRRYEMLAAITGESPWVHYARTLVDQYGERGAEYYCGAYDLREEKKYLDDNTVDFEIGRSRAETDAWMYRKQDRSEPPHPWWRFW
jgi:hypothetical protein